MLNSKRVSEPEDLYLRELVSSGIAEPGGVKQVLGHYKRGR